MFSPPSELSQPPEWIGWDVWYEYVEGGEYVGGAWPSVEPPVGRYGYEYDVYPYGRGGGYEYGGGALVEPPDGGWQYGYGREAPIEGAAGGGGYEYESILIWWRI
jgi:hypothetical protein